MLLLFRTQRKDAGFLIDCTEFPNVLVPDKEITTIDTDSARLRCSRSRAPAPFTSAAASRPLPRPLPRKRA
jgi:hypothetical protein